MGRPTNSDSAKKCGWCAAAMCAKRSPLRAQRCAARRLRLRVRRPTRPRMWQALRAKEDARVYAELQSKSSVPRTATTRRLARPLARRLCSEPRSCSQPAGQHASAVSSEGTLRLCLAGSLACASEFKPLARPESAREREPRERGLGLRVPVCACAVIALAGVPLLASSDQRNGHLYRRVLLASSDQRRNKKKYQKKYLCLRNRKRP